MPWEWNKGNRKIFIKTETEKQLWKREIMFKERVVRIQVRLNLGWDTCNIRFQLHLSRPLMALLYITCKTNSDVNFWAFYLGRLIFEHFLSYFRQISDIQKRMANIRITYTRHAPEYDLAKKTGPIRVMSISKFWKYARIFFLAQICSSKITVFLAVRFTKQKMPADKYPSIFSRQMEGIAVYFIISAISSS